LSKQKTVARRGQRSKIGLVLDCSIVMAWYFADEKSDYADSVARGLGDRSAFVPMNWTLEVANTLLVGERRQRSTIVQAENFIVNLAAMPIVIDDETNAHAWKTVLSLAREQKLSAYAAAYLELAIRRRLPLATLDEKLKSAAQSVGVSEFKP
jgi:predicted nucleic acid-binding protein